MVKPADVIPAGFVLFSSPSHSAWFGSIALSVWIISSSWLENALKFFFEMRSGPVWAWEWILHERREWSREISWRSVCLKRTYWEHYQNALIFFSFFYLALILKHLYVVYNSLCASSFYSFLYQKCTSIFLFDWCFISQNNGHLCLVVVLKTYMSTVFFFHKHIFYGMSNQYV